MWKTEIAAAEALKRDGWRWFNQRLFCKRVSGRSIWGVLEWNGGGIRPGPTA